MFIAIFSVVILLGIGGYFFAKRLEKEVQQDKQYLPDDGLIYDPISGRNLTLEEAEHGIVLPDNALARVKTDEEIETYYAHDAKERAYIERDLIVSGAIAVALELLTWIDHSAMVRQLRSFQVHFMYEVAPGRYLGLANVGYRHSSVAGSEYQFVGFISGTFAGHHDRALLEALEIETLANGMLLRLPRVATRADFARLLTLVRQAVTTAA